MINKKLVTYLSLNLIFKSINLIFHTSIISLDCGSVEERRKIRNDLKCKDFHWYINNIYPELMVPANGDFAFGTIHWEHPTWLKCIDSLAPGEEILIGSLNCLQTYYPQRFR